MGSKDLLTASYDYNLPKEFIATSPARPADSARLLIYNKADESITHTTFKNILEYIPANCSIFLNDTKVIKARIYGNKSSGGKVELLVIKPLPENRYIVMVKGRVKIGTTIKFEQNLKATIEGLNEDGSRVVKFYQKDLELNFEQLVEVLEQIGHIPLPPYMNREDSKEDELDYQTLFAKEDGSVAAPTASLHFTTELLEKLYNKFDVHTLTLHVGAGTFKPVDAKNIQEHPMHSEYYNIPKNAQSVIDSKQKILAVGTTVTRTIEFYERTKKANGECDLFLHPHNKPQRVDYLLTNFHLPKSTLIMLVSAFLGRDETLKLYNEAIKEGYRFYSYGDAMLII